MEALDWCKVVGANPTGATIYKGKTFINRVIIVMHKNKDEHNAWFRKYYAANRQKYIDAAARRHAANRKWFEETFKDILFCKVCGETERCCLDFHHVNPAEKEEGLANMIKTYSHERIEAEVKKCVILCANCHRKLHAGVIQI